MSRNDYNISQMFRTNEKQCGYVRESAFYNLELLLNGISTDLISSYSEVYESIGTKIHNTIKEKLI